MGKFSWKGCVFSANDYSLKTRSNISPGVIIGGNGLGDPNPNFSQISSVSKCVTQKRCMDIDGSIYVFNNEVYCIYCRENSEFSSKTRRCECVPGFAIDIYDQCSVNPNFCRIG